MKVVAGDVEMPPGDIEKALGVLEAAVEKAARAGAIPVVLGGDHSIGFPGAKGVVNVLGHGRVSMIHFDAHADTGPSRGKSRPGPRHRSMARPSRRQ